MKPVRVGLLGAGTVGGGTLQGIGNAPARYDRAIVIDAICSGAAPGTIHHLATGDMPTQRSASSHDMTLPTALALGRQAGLQLPEDEAILLVGIEADDILNFGETCTPAVAAAVPRAVADVLAVLDSLPQPEKAGALSA